MKSPLYEHLLAVAEELGAKHRVSASYTNRTGKGDMREDALNGWLREFLSAQLAVSKGEIVDSEGQRSREFDCVVHIPSLTPRIFGRSERHSIPVEEVLAVVEVKSQLREKDVSEFSAALEALGTFKRNYEPSNAFQMFAALNGTKSKAFSVQCSRSKQAIGAVEGLLFAYSTRSCKSIHAGFRQNKYATMLSCVHVLNRALWTRLKASWAYTYADDSFAMFAALLLQLTTDRNDRWTFVRPCIDRYVAPVLSSLDARAAATEVGFTMVEPMGRAR